MIHTNPNCPCYILDKQSGVSRSSKNKVELPENGSKMCFSGGDSKSDVYTERGHNDSGGASRYFYVAKVSKKERNMGLDSFEDNIPIGRDPNQDKTDTTHKPRPTLTKNNHPCLKPINLLTYLCRLVTPKGGIILDTFMGSGSTGIAALLEGFDFIGMEMDAHYFEIAEARINKYEEYRSLLKNNV